jgi:hypothetical protein
MYNRQLKIACIMNGNDGSCTVHHLDGDTVVQMAKHFQADQDTIILRAEEILTASSTDVAREALIQIVPAVESKYRCLMLLQRRTIKTAKWHLLKS